MADLSKVAEAFRPPSVRHYRGQVCTVEGRTCVNIAGRVLRATWADPLVVKDGDFVNVEITRGGAGQAVAHVASRTALQPRPRTGTVTAVPSGASAVTVTAGGVAYQAEFIGSYAANDRVHLDWGAGRPRVIGKVSKMAEVSVPNEVMPATLPALPNTGRAFAPALETNTYVTGKGWGVHAGGGDAVYQGTSPEGDECFGSWFYGRGFSTLRKKTVTRILFQTAFRRYVGDYDKPVVFNFYAHTSMYRPTNGRDVTRVTGPFTVEVPATSHGVQIELPLDFAPALLMGGGISIAGDPYAGYEGRGTTADSGALIVEWVGQ